MFRFVVVFSLALGVLSGGKLSRLGELRLQRFQWIAGSFVVKFGSILLLTGRIAPSPVLCTVIALATYLMLFYGLYPNLRLPGFFALASGIFLNFLVIVANGGRMPVDPTGIGLDLLDSQVQALASSFTHQRITGNVRLRFLADIFGWKFLSKTPTTFSAGDVVMAAGIFWFILHTLHRGFPEAQNDVKIN
ncbi:MAG TPA: DUF5317 domain-containing protein [Firmicutes bacterium]|nr:DUF5317 domain-containing protein [Candidatus Fermentithermobacillaceae bacterium]